MVCGQFIKTGQTCIASDYLLVNRHIKPTLLKQLKKFIQEFYGDNPTNSPDYA
ncbi:MAG: hypothetical protein ACQZ3N_01895 [cyanobacterium endosymbiont of Rhopalodia yunnanensis]